MKVIIAGSRDISYSIRAAVEESKFTDITEIVSGGAKGIDRLGERWGYDNQLKVTRFIPDWNKYHLAAGPIRNKQMADYADALIAIWDKQSKGTYHMIRTMRQVGKPVHVVEVLQGGR